MPISRQTFEVVDNLVAETPEDRREIVRSGLLEIAATMQDKLGLSGEALHGVIRISWERAWKNWNIADGRLSYSEQKAFDDGELVSARISFRDAANAYGFVADDDHVTSIIRLLGVASDRVIASSSFHRLSARIIEHLEALRQDMAALNTPKPSGKDQSEKPPVTAARAGHLKAVEEALRSAAGVANKLRERVFGVVLDDIELGSNEQHLPITVSVRVNPFDETPGGGGVFEIDLGPPMAVIDFDERIDEEFERRAKRRDVEALEKFLGDRSQAARQNTKPRQEESHADTWKKWCDFLWFFQEVLKREPNEKKARKLAKAEYWRYLEKRCAPTSKEDKDRVYRGSLNKYICIKQLNRFEKELKTYRPA
jgi:hypothetical protein